MPLLNKLKEKAQKLKDKFFSLAKTENRASVIKKAFVGFVDNNFKITSTKNSKIVGIVLLAITLLWTVLSVNTFISQEFSSKWLLLAFALICPFILGLSAAFSVRIKNDTFNKVWHLVF